VRPRFFYPVLLAVMLVIAAVGAACTPSHYGSDFRNVASVRKSTVISTVESYGSDPLQVVTLTRDMAVTSPRKLVILLHGGGWTTGGRGSLVDEAAMYAADGWVVVNVSYRVGVADGIPGDGKYILADVETVLNKYRAKPYVDPGKVLVYGESAGGQLSTWLGAKDGAKVKALVALSPVSSISGAIGAGLVPGAAANVVALGAKAGEFFGYSVGTTDWHRYGDRVQHAAVALSTDEWVDPNIHGRVFCAALTNRCHLFEFPGDLHAGALAAAHPELVTGLMHWADTQVG